MRKGCAVREETGVDRMACRRVEDELISTRGASSLEINIRVGLGFHSLRRSFNVIFLESFSCLLIRQTVKRPSEIIDEQLL